ncbi:ABC transporter ATP-binding protein [Desulfopila sp. IMCC35008]|uniref:ABC transporter ATP-binding protein n=1 Tax=Desulfopila sp. IMCC35008 TaxID=2653858 RepID=UPI0013D2EA77|nr:sn-glycerol-3-phosphate ABC transporter ATP-binding protein UgpC [Desulfopila sp. IMCC35008]
MAHVELKGVVKRFGTTEVVHGVDLEITDNEFIVLVGPSGCGKSTILRMIAGLESVSGGEIHINGRPVNEVDPKDRNVAMVFQNYALYPHMTVYENMAFSLRMARASRDEIEKKVQDAAAILELTPYLQRKPAELSGGQRQRVAMGRAIVRQPAVFLFDEPLSNLDAQLRTQMRMELKKLHLKMQTTTIYVTHDQVEAMTLADRIVILKDGYIQQVGTPIEVFEEPVNRFVGGFIGNPPINIVDGVISSTEGAVSVRFGEIELPLLNPPQLAEETQVLVGIRPDAIKGGNNLNMLSSEWRITGEVLVAEILGGQSLIEFTAGGNTMVAELEGRIRIRPGEKVELAIDAERLLFFDPQTEEAVY